MSYNPAADKDRPQGDAWTTPAGLVQITAPVGALPYYRLSWIDPVTEKRQQTTAGKTFARAWGKALEREKLLGVGVGARHEQPANAGIDYWLAPERPTPRGWGRSHRKTMTYYAKRYFRPLLGSKPCYQLRRSDFQKAVNSAPTYNEGANVRRAASSLISALRQGEYLADGHVIDLTGVWWHGERPQQDVEQVAYVQQWERPSHAQVAALRVAAENLVCRYTESKTLWWRGLMVELAAYAGPRWSELIALDVDKIHADERKIDIHWRVDHTQGGPKLELPKMAKRRTTIYPEVSPTGYRLEEQLRRRVAEVEAEHAAGTNPLRLLFPTRHGGYQLTGNFHRDVFEKAAQAAGWDSKMVEAPYGDGVRTERQWVHTWHSLRHTFCTVALDEWGLPDTTVALLAGHADTTTTRRLYVDAAEDALDVALEATKQQ